MGRGTFTLHPKITALSATTATVVDCAYSTAVLGVPSDRQAGTADHAAGERRGDLDTGADRRDVEGLQADGDGREMRARVVTAAIVVVWPWRRCRWRSVPGMGERPRRAERVRQRPGVGRPAHGAGRAHLLDAAGGLVVGHAGGE